MKNSCSMEVLVAPENSSIMNWFFSSPYFCSIGLVPEVQFPEILSSKQTVKNRGCKVFCFAAIEFNRDYPYIDIGSSFFRITIEN